MGRFMMIASGLVLVTAACGGDADTSEPDAPTTSLAATSSTSAITSTSAAATTTNADASEIAISTPAFDDEGPIPVRFTCDGADVSPPLLIDEVPPAAKTLVLIMEDPDAPVGVWDHWVVFNIDVVSEIPEDVGSLGTSGSNSWNRLGYGGPCPPDGTHRYFFAIYALDTSLDLVEGANKESVLEAMRGHLLAEDTLMGTYTR
jgi:Raf kinase inhibitor-like YbhB/YbcL family protein